MSPGNGRPPLGRGLLVAFVAVQAGIGLLLHVDFFEQMLGFPSRVGARGEPGAFTSLLLLAAVAAVAALWADLLPAERPASERFGAAGLALLAALGLLHLAAALAAGGRLFPWLTWVLVDAAAGAALLLRMRRRGASPPAVASVPFTWADAASALFLATLLVPALFAYIHYDAAAIWACRAYGLADQGDLHALLSCRYPNYPPLFSILLWLGIDDPVFEGRLLPWAALVLFALFFRGRLASLVGRAAPAALLFFVATVQVWQGAAMYYANVPLMAFLSAGALLAWGLPRGEAAGPSRAEQGAGAVCLAAAILVRPDGFVYVTVLAVAAVVVRVREGRRLSLAPFAGPALALLAWSLRPGALRAPGDFFSSGTGAWRAAGVLPTLVTFANGLQGQWLAHKGFGTAFFLLAAALVIRLRARRAGGDTGLFGLVTLGSLGAVALCYVAIPFVGDVWQAAQPFEGTWLEAYLHFIRVGAGRMTVHLYPFAVLYAAAAFAERAREGARRAGDDAQQEAPARLAAGGRS